MSSNSSYINEDGDVVIGKREKKRKLHGKPEPMDQQKRLVVVLEGACLETVKVGERYELLNVDDHLRLMQRKKRDLSEARSDVTHQCLMNLLDSPLNKAGLLQIFIHTRKNVLIEVNPHVRLPRTFKRFAGLIVQLLDKLKIRSSSQGEILLRVVKNPVTGYLPAGAQRIATSCKADNPVPLDQFLPTISKTKNDPVVFIIGCFAKGNVNVDYADKTIAFSEYPLSAAMSCAKVTSAFEQFWGVV
mmetsp:Transcript_7846/g.13663  ORF Transcript_7846/g.13663 Transcript_7846/m.13663 type:complete len:245 (-) Transcript_7846:27-761(-)